MVNQMVEDVTAQQRRDLNEFVGSSIATRALIELVTNFTQEQGTVYRGMMYLKENLKVGNVYVPETEISSWTTSKDVGISFACNDYIPEGYMEDLYEEKHGELLSVIDMEESRYIEIEESFGRVLFINNQGRGFLVNEHLSEHPFNKEQEVMTYLGQWRFTAIDRAETDEGKEYFLVTVEQE